MKAGQRGLNVDRRLCGNEATLKLRRWRIEAKAGWKHRIRGDSIQIWGNPND
jgi:hypothetical protein